MNLSLHSFAKTHNLAKSSVHSRCKDLGIDTANGLDEDAIARLKAEFGIKDPAAVVDEAPGSGLMLPTRTMRHGSLVSIGARRPVLPQQVFDVQAYQEEKADLNLDASQQAAAVNDAIQAYAQARIASVLADIDLAADSIRANALGAMGVQVGKDVSA